MCLWILSFLFLGKYNHSFTRLACGHNKEQHVFCFDGLNFL